MQKSWMEDSKKCTFILLDPSLPDSDGTGAHGGGMAGDTNFFWNDYDEPDTVELEVMVAEARCRRKGLAREALGLFMAYGAGKLEVSKFRVKIGYANTASLALFASLGFEEVSRAECFKEVTLELPVEGEAGERLKAAGAQLQFQPYDS
mmetsp:Transcript_32074/g.102165  ORF Transcript_32074/g.102165 Transcript_32074/m.102165 type:complete len:149 (+) Transcript_32074:413-859(+)